MKVTRNLALRLIAMAPITLLCSPAFGVTPLPGQFVGWGLMTVILGNLFVALWGDGHQGHRYASGGDL